MSHSSPKSLTTAVGASWALLLGFGILMLGDGLQGMLLPLRAFREGFSTTMTGLMMSLFYAGFLGGSIWAPKIVQRVGHIRVFAALAALASASILIHAAIIHPVTWIVLRLISGFCFSGIYIVAESWLNDSTSNETRGQLLSIYMVITYVAIGIGQLFLNLSDPVGYPLFILTSVLISVAVVPLLLSASPAPRFEESSSVKLTELYKISPLGVAGMFGEGLVTAAVFALGPVYAALQGLSNAQISYFMTAPVLVAVLLQWPIGHLSDKYDRRLVLTVVTLAAAAASVVCVFTAELSVWWVIIAFGVFGGFALPMYSLCMAHTNDHLNPEQMVAASGGLILAGGIGAILGPFAISLVMNVSHAGFFWTLAGVHAGIGLFAIYRMLKRKATPLEKQGHHAPVTLRPSSRVVESIQEHLRDDYPHDETNDASKESE